MKQQAIIFFRTRLPLELACLVLMAPAVSCSGSSKTGGDSAQDGDGADETDDVFDETSPADVHDAVEDAPPADNGEDETAPPDAVEEPCSPPDTVLSDGRCVPSCGFAGGNVCSDDPASCEGYDLLESYDCATCCLQAPACTAAAEPTPAPGCPFSTEVVVFAPEGWNVTGDQFAANLSPCANYWVSVQPVDDPDFPDLDKLAMRPGQAALMHDRGPRVHALALFHYASWSRYREATGESWLEIGRRFRAIMLEAGYCVESGDSWAIDEMPSAIRTDPSTRDGFASLVRGLHEGEAGMPESRGAVFVWGMGHATENFSVYKPSVESWLADATFWERMNLHVRWWAQEVYTNPLNSCVGTESIDARARQVNEFTMHVPRLAAAAPDSAGVNTAQSYLSRAYVPLMNAVWDADPSHGYGDTTIPLVQMQHFITLQVRAARGWADGHTYPDGRVGFGIASYHTPKEWETLARAMALGILGAYGDDGAGAAGACMEGGVDTWCSCNVPGSAFNDGWETFATW